VVEVPDALALEMEGLSRRVALGDVRGESRLPLRSLSLVRDGRVVSSNDPDVPRSFPPAPLGAEPLSAPAWLPALEGERDEWLAGVNWRDAIARGVAEFGTRQETIVRGARRDLETLKDEVLQQPPELDRWAADKGYDVTIYRKGTLHASSVEGLVDAEILPRRL